MATQHKVFIDVEVDDSIRDDAALAAKLEEVCPVDIFKNAGGQVEVVDENVDECVLCRLCLEAAPAGTVHVKKLYDGTELISSELSVCICAPSGLMQTLTQLGLASRRPGGRRRCCRRSSETGSGPWVRAVIFTVSGMPTRHGSSGR